MRPVRLESSWPCPEEQRLPPRVRSVGDSPSQRETRWTLRNGRGPHRSAPSDAPGAASCGNAGATTPHMTPRDTAHYSDTSPSPSQHRRAPSPTWLPPSGWPAPLSPNARPARAERAALDSKPPSAYPTREVDRGRLRRRLDHRDRTPRRLIGDPLERSARTVSISRFLFLANGRCVAAVVPGRPCFPHD